MVTGIKNWSTTPGDNDAAPPNGAPEGMPPSSVNDVQRQNMAEIRKWYDDPIWIDLGNTLSYVDADTFRLSGDKTAIYQVGRRVRATGSTPFIIYGTITASVFSSPNTDVTVDFDSGTLNSDLTDVAISAIPVTGKPVTSSNVIFEDDSIPTSAIDGLDEVLDPIEADITALEATVVAGTKTTTLKTGSGTFTSDLKAFRQKVRMIAGGGGGGAQVTNAGSDGTDTTFGSVTAKGGKGGSAGGAAGDGGAGGTGGSGTCDFRIQGSGGGAGVGAAQGGNGPFGGAGQPKYNAQGGAGGVNSGGGGAAGGTATGNLVYGGGAGEYVEITIEEDDIEATYAYTIGTGGAGAAGGGNAGADGGSGMIIIEEWLRA